MFGLIELAKRFLDDINDNKNMAIKVVDSFISNVSEVTGLDEKAIKAVGKIIGGESCGKDCYNIFGTVYNLNYIDEFLNDRDCYYINDFDIEELCVQLKYDCDEDGDWIPIIFIKEFWSYYSTYTTENRKETEEEANNEQNISTKICSILDSAIELKHIRSSLENLNFHYNEICEILEIIVKKLH